MRKISEYLAEANVLNASDLRDKLLPAMAKEIPEPYRKQFIKTAYTDLVNDAKHHKKVSRLPDDAPTWAQSAFDSGDLVTASISVDYRQELERILHWIKSLVEHATSHPAAGDQRGIEDRRSAQTQLAGLNRLTIDAMLNLEQLWWARHAEVIKGETSGMTKVADVTNKYSWWRLDDEEAYRREGQVLQNCIGSHWTKGRTAASGLSILILKDPSLESHVAMRIRTKDVATGIRTKDKAVLEVKGMNNRPPAAVYLGYTNELMKKLGLVVAPDGMKDLENSGYTWIPELGIVHLSHEFPFEMGPSIGGLILVKWTCPSSYWRRSFAGLYNTVAGEITDGAMRYDLVAKRNQQHPILSLAIQGSRLVAVGNLQNPNYIIKQAGMQKLRDTLEDICKALHVTPDAGLTGNDNRPGLRRYGIEVNNGRFTANHELAVAVSVRATPKSIGSIPNPSEVLQIAAIKGDPSVIELIENPTATAMQTAVELSHYPHNIINKLVERLGDDAVPESVQLAAVTKDGLSIESLRSPSETVELAAVKQNEHAFAYICYWHSETDRGIPGRAVTAAAAAQNVHALEDLQTYGFEASPEMQMRCAKSHEADPGELEMILEIMGDGIDGRVRAFIKQRLANPA